MYGKTYSVYVLNLQALREAIKQRGFHGFKPFLEHLGLHRNTLDRYMRGASVLPRSVEQVITALDLPIERALNDTRAGAAEAIMPLVEKIHRAHPAGSIFLFGSRARGTARRYSDFDIGVYTHSGTDHVDFLKILEFKEQFEEISPVRVECINMNNASPEFLREISHEMILLAGYDRDKVELLRRAHDHREQ